MTEGNATGTRVAPKFGGRASALYAAPDFADVNGQAEIAAQYITQLKSQAATVLASTIGATLVPVAYNGDFNWYWTDGSSTGIQSNVNVLSYNYMSAAATHTPGTDVVQISGTGQFALLYQQLIKGIAYQFSAADSATLQDALTNSSAQATTLVQTYNSIYGAPTPAQIAAAKQTIPAISTTLDYILLYAAGYQWSGTASGQQGQSLYAMQQSQNLRQLLQYAPPSAQPIIMEISAYLNALGAGAPIQDSQSQGLFTLAMIQNNLLPSATNGGIQLAYPTTAAYYLGYQSNNIPSQILTNLKDVDQKFTLSFTAQKTESSSYNIAFEGGAGIEFAGDLIDISAGTSWRGDVGGASGSGSSMSISMVYPGVTTIPFAPTAYQQSSAGTQGWFTEAVIYQAWTNFKAGANAPSGFTFQNAVPGGIALGEQGVAYLKALVVSGYPTITVTYEQGDYASFSAWLATHTTVSVSLFGFIPLGSSSVDTYNASASQSSSGSGFTLTLTPPAPGSSGQIIPTQFQTVPVLAAQLFPLGLTQA